MATLPRGVPTSDWSDDQTNQWNQQWRSSDLYRSTLKNLGLNPDQPGGVQLNEQQRLALQGALNQAMGGQFAGHDVALDNSGNVHSNSNVLGDVAKFGLPALGIGASLFGIPGLFGGLLGGGADTAAAGDITGEIGANVGSSGGVSVADEAISPFANAGAGVDELGNPIGTFGADSEAANSGVVNGGDLSGLTEGADPSSMAGMDPNSVMPSDSAYSAAESPTSPPSDSSDPLGLNNGPGLFSKALGLSGNSLGGILAKSGLGFLAGMIPKHTTTTTTSQRVIDPAKATQFEGLFGQGLSRIQNAPTIGDISVGSIPTTTSPALPQPIGVTNAVSRRALPGSTPGVTPTGGPYSPDEIQHLMQNVQQLVGSQGQ